MTPPLDKVAKINNNLDLKLRRIHYRYYTIAEEIEVLRPRLVRFPTGPGYDRHLAKALPGFKTEGLDYPGMSRIHELEELLASGGVALKTYHPQWSKGFRIKAIASYPNSQL